MFLWILLRLETLVLALATLEIRAVFLLQQALENIYLGVEVSANKIRTKLPYC